MHKPSLATLLACTALAAGLLPAAALAQAAPAADAGAADDADTIVVFGRGETRQVTAIAQPDLRLLTPGSSPLKAIEKLPGVNFQSADPFGAYEWSTRISLRGFNQNQLGFTLDGIPLGDMSYGNTNGLHISRAIISDNIAVTRVSQGAGALSTASTSNLGGTLEFISRDPGKDFGLSVNGTYGSSDTYRVFARVDTGQQGSVRASLSYAYLNAGKWKGDGEQRQHQVNAKAVIDLSDSASLTGFVNYSDRRENDYQDLSLEMIGRLGYGWDNLAPDWARAVAVAKVYQSGGTLFPAPIRTVDDAYYDAAGLRRDWLAGLKLAAEITSGVNVSIQPYYHSNKGQGIWFTPYVPTPGGAPISIRTTEYDIKRYGIVSSVQVELGAHLIDTGFWVENNDFTQSRRFYGLADADRPSRRALSFQSDPFFTQWSFDFNTETVQIYLQDRWNIGDNFTLTAGFKGQSVRNTSRRLVPGTSPAAGNIRNADWFLPQVGVVYRLAGQNELFASYTENRRAFTSAATSGPFSTTQTGFDAIRSTLKPESSKTVEGGFRFATGPVQGVLAAYYVDFSNRLLGITTGAGIVGNPVVLQNVGSVRSWGLEAAANWRITGPLGLFASYSYNDSTYRDDVVNAAGTVLAAIRGKQTVDTPRHLAKAELVYDAGSGPFGRAGVNYMSRRYFTYTNDQSVPGRALVDASIGWRFADTGGFADGFEIQGSVTNLFDKDYVATIGSNGFGNSGDNQTLLAGAPRQWFITVRKDF
jgi:iron complex outermembrane receptor protein